jgi:tripartite-type tricarboxylate transporter receptor subunit TctC
VAGIERASVLPNVPTITETVSGYEFVGTWYGMLTQTKVDRAIVTRINQVLNAALRSEDIRQTLISQGSDPRPMSVEDFTRFVRSDCPNWARAVKLAGIKPE